MSASTPSPRAQSHQWTIWREWRASILDAKTRIKLCEIWCSVPILVEAKARDKYSLEIVQSSVLTHHSLQTLSLWYTPRVDAPNTQHLILPLTPLFLIHFKILLYFFYNWNFIPFNFFSPFSLAQCLVTTILLSVSVKSFFCLFCFDFWILNTNDSIKHLSFSLWLTLVTIMSCKFMHVFTNDRISFFSWPSNTLLHTYTYTFIYSFIHQRTFRLFPYLDYCE